MQRRGLFQYTAVGSLTVVAGCVSLWTENSSEPAESSDASRGTTDVVVHNESQERRAIHVRITPDDKYTMDVDTTVDLDPSGRHRFTNAIMHDAQYTVFVSADGIEETLEESAVDGVLQIIVEGTSNVVFAEQIG